MVSTKGKLRQFFFGSNITANSMIYGKKKRKFGFVRVDVQNYSRHNVT
jgi:hypothetical protein